MATGLDDAGELSEAVTMYNAVALKNKQGVDATDQFIMDYTAARTQMIEQGLIVAHDPKSEQREIEDLKKKLEGSEVLKFLMELPEFPRSVDDLDPELARTTMVGRMRQWVRARRGPGLGSQANTPKQTGENNLFLKNQLRKITDLLKDPKTKRRRTIRRRTIRKLTSSCFRRMENVFAQPATRKEVKVPRGQTLKEARVIVHAAMATTLNAVIAQTRRRLQRTASTLRRTARSASRAGTTS